MPGFAVESHPERAKIIEQIIAGKTTRSIGASAVPPVPHSAVQRYKTNVVMPMLRSVEYQNRSLLGEPLAPPLPSVTKTASKQVQAVQQAIQAAPAQSIFRKRLEDLNGRIVRTLDRAESAVRVTTDKDGNEVVIGQDISPMAPLFNAASKNLEMLGRATGELEPAGGSQVSIQIVCPSAPGGDQTPRITFSSIDQIEAAEPGEDEDGCLEIGIKQLPE